MRRNPAGERLFRSKRRADEGRRQIRGLRRGVTASGEKVEAKLAQPRCREILSKARHGGTVPQTDTGGQDEKSEALERPRVKELGKMHT